MLVISQLILVIFILFVYCLFGTFLFLKLEDSKVFNIHDDFKTYMFYMIFWPVISYIKLIELLWKTVKEPWKNFRKIKK